MTATEETTAGRWTVITCVLPACSTCGNGPDNDYDYIPHFHLEQAREDLVRDYGWRVLPPGQDGAEILLCKSCAAAADCARLGHQVESSEPFRLGNGALVGARTWCERCETVLTWEPTTPPPPGYPAPERAHHGLAWDAAALPDGGDIAEAARRLLSRLSDDAVSARCDAWDGDQPDRADWLLADPDPEADKAAARTLTAAITRLLGTEIAVGEGRAS